MRKIENFKIGLAALRGNKLRTFLTMLGIVFGVASVIAMLSIGEGARQESLEQLEKMGTKNIIIERTDAEVVNGKNASYSPGLTVNDVESIKKIHPNVETVSPECSNNIQINYKNFREIIQVHSITPSYAKAFNLNLLEGRFLQEHHLTNKSNVCVISDGLKKKIAPFRNPIGDYIKVNDLWFEIIGIVSRKKNESLSDNKTQLTEPKIYLPLTTFKYKVDLTKPKDSSSDIVFFNPTQENNTAKVVDRKSIDKIIVSLKSDSNLHEDALLVKNILKRKHFGIKDYKVTIPVLLMEQKQKTQNIFNIVMGAIAGISLLVGGIGIMNIMLANIMERTREIGIRRAIGATQKDILSQFLYEALFISVVGGMLGVIIGFILTSLITSYADWRTIITPYSVILSFMVAVGTGLGFGIFPAKKASEKDPIESLRYE